MMAQVLQNFGTRCVYVLAFPLFLVPILAFPPALNYKGRQCLGLAQTLSNIEDHEQFCPGRSK